MRPKGKKASGRVFLDPHWQACYVAFFAHLVAKHRSSETLRKYDEMLRRFFCSRSKTPARYTPAQIEAFIIANGVDGQPVAASTTNLRLAAIRCFYLYASTRYLVPISPRKMRPILLGVNPAALVDSVPITETTRRALSEEEVRRFFAAIPRDTLIGKRDRALFLCYLFLGRRRAEIVHLLWGDLRQEKQTWYYVWKGKGRAGKNVVGAELTPPAMEAIREYLIAAGRWGNMQPDEPVFQCSQLFNGKNKGLQPDAVDHIFHKYARRAELPREVLTVHSWRATAAILRYDQDPERDLLKVQEFLDHSNINQSVKYLKKRPKQEVDIIGAAVAAQLTGL